jgi:DNA invertase Pin-like site-specific DNA recombinase
MKMLGYVRVSTEEQSASGLGMLAQEAKIREYSERHGHELVLHRDEGSSGKSLEREGLMECLEVIANGDAGGLVVARLDRLTRSLLDFARLLEWFRTADAALVALDVDVDTSTPGGRLIAGVFAVVAEWEREMISQRTKDGLAQAPKRNQGSVADEPALHHRMLELRREGLTYAEICQVLEAERWPTLRGGRAWRPSNLQSVLGARPARKARKHVALPEPGRR